MQAAHSPPEAEAGTDQAMAWAWPWRLAAALPSLCFLVVVLAPPFNHDAAAVLSFAERWLAGERLYTDLIDVNPPLIFVLNLAPAVIGAATPLPAIVALQLCLLGLCLAAVALSLLILRRDPTAGSVMAACLTACLPLLCLAAGYEFGQREHIMAVAALPYLLLAAQRAEGREGAGPWLCAAVALLAALGFALKPHFLAIPALVEALVLLRRGPAAALRDRLPWIMAAAWAAYLTAIPLLFPDYLGLVLPMVREYYLDLGDLGWWQVLLTERLATALLVLLPLGAVAFARGVRSGALPQVLALAGLGAVASAAVQAKGWDYHALPARLFAGLLAVCIAARWLDNALPPAAARRAAPAAALGVLLMLAVFQVSGAAAPWRELRWDTSDGAMLTRALARDAAGQRVLVLSPYIDPVYQALAYVGARATLPTMTIWPLQGAYGGAHGGNCARPDAGPAGTPRYRDPREMPPAEALLWRRVVRDFAARPPAALLVASNPRVANCGRGFDVIEYFARHPAFAATLRRYRAGPVVGDHRLYLRHD